MYGKGLSVACVPFYPCGDRFVPTGYREDSDSLEEKLEKIAGMGDVTGVELSYPAEFEDPSDMAAMLKRVAIDEMMHIEMLAERILFLGGDVEMVPNGDVEKVTERTHTIDQTPAIRNYIVCQILITLEQCAQNYAIRRININSAGDNFGIDNSNPVGYLAECLLVDGNGLIGTLCIISGLIAAVVTD